MTGEVPPPLPPIIASPPLISECRRPKVLTFYRVWCALFVVLYVAFGVRSILIAHGTLEPNFGLLEDYVSKHNPDLRSAWVAEKRADAPSLAAFVFAIALLYLAAALIPRKPWAWVFGIVTLATTVFPFIITVAGMLPLLIYWLSPEVKRYFGKPACFSAR
jgi:hypothetical protein